MKQKSKEFLKIVLRVVIEIIRHFTICKKQSQKPVHPEQNEEKESENN
jgi:hypothetical protein